MMMGMRIGKMLKMSSLRKSPRKNFTNSIIRFAGYALKSPIILLEYWYFLKILDLRSNAECCGVITEIQNWHYALGDDVGLVWSPITGQIRPEDGHLG
jgi:hypothetical protein